MANTNLELYPYRESRQFEKYISQFIRIFKGFQYDADGSGRIERVPVYYGAMDRIVAGILSKNDVHQNKRIPLMAVNLSAINLDTTGARPRVHRDNLANIASSKPAKERVIVNRLVGPSFVMDMELAIYASSTVELFNIVEQILLIFNPRVTISIEDNAKAGNTITEVSLESLQDEIQYPLGTEKRIIQMTMNFSMPVRLNYPSDLSGEIIKQIHTNIIADDESNVKDTIGELEDELDTEIGEEEEGGNENGG